MKLLLVEDEAKTADTLRKGLQESGFVVDLARDGEEGLHFALTCPYEAMILDVMLPGRDGWAVLEGLRESGLRTPVLFLTARDAVEDRVRGLNLGADDYLVKPFAFAELLARVHSLLRRAPSWQPAPVRVADLEVDPLRHAASRRGQRLDLTPKEMVLLTFLARHAGQVMSRTRIAEGVWDMNFDPESNVIDVHVRRLRAKVDDPFETRLIHTVRGVGYVLQEAT